MIRYENLVAISQILVAKSLRCIVLSSKTKYNVIMSPQYLWVATLSRLIKVYHNRV